MDPPSLCQPDDTKSCGACCGLYNHARTDRADLHRRLFRRTLEFLRIEQPSPAAVLEFGRRIRASEPSGKRLQTIYNCEYLGFLDPGCRRVGCLLHPALHGGVDLRSCSFYGRDVCAEHLCLSHEKLTREEKWCVIYSLEDWYLYGLCITDIDFCKALFSQAGRRLGEQPRRSALARPEARKTARGFFELKISWPFKSRDERRFGKYWLADEEYGEARIPYESFGIDESPFNAIFLSLASEFTSARDVRRAERLVENKIAAFVRACE